MAVPQWFVFLVAAWVLIFGVFRIYVALKRDGDDPTVDHWKTKAAFGRTKRAHLIYGVIYIVMGGLLTAMGLGVEMPFASGCREMLTPKDAVESGAPSGGVEVETPSPQ